MSNVIEKIRYLLNTKRLIKQAIQDMGVQNVSDVFRSYPDKIREIEQIRTEKLKCDTFPIEMQEDSIDIGFVDNVINVRADKVLILPVDPDNIFELTESSSYDPNSEYGGGDGGFVP